MEKGRRGEFVVSKSRFSSHKIFFILKRTIRNIFIDFYIITHENHLFLTKRIFNVLNWNELQSFAKIDRKKPYFFINFYKIIWFLLCILKNLSLLT